MTGAADIIHRDEEDGALRLKLARAGLTGPEDSRWFWRNEAETRVAALEEDAGFFGLLPHEERELEALKALLEEFPA